MNQTELLEEFEELVEKNVSKHLLEFVQNNLQQILNSCEIQKRMAKTLVEYRNNIYWIFKKKFQGQLVSILSKMLDICSWYLDENSTDVAYLERIMLDMNKINFTDDVVLSWFAEFTNAVPNREDLYIPFTKRLYHSNKRLCGKILRSMKGNRIMYGVFLDKLFQQRPDISNYYSTL